MSDRIARLASLFLVLLAALAGTAPRAQERLVLVLEVEGPIGPATADYVDRGLETAAGRGAELVVLRMDTPGGLADSMRLIIRGILSSPIPVATYVAPSGARAASAGTYILYASHIAAMAPGTNLGAATPVQIGGGFPGSPEPEEPKRQPPPDDGEGDGSPSGGTGPTDAGMQEKVVNDSAAYIRSLAQLRERNAEWAERAVREAASLSASEALEENVIGHIAPNLPALLEAIDGSTVEIEGERQTLETRGALLETVAPGWRTELLAILTNPNVAYILMLIGIYGIIFEFYSPGLVFPGVVGAISLLLALYAFQVLPVNTAGLALIGLGLAMIIGEMLVPSFGALGIGGIVAFVVGSIMLMDTDAPGFGIAWQVVAGVAGTASGALLLMIWFLARSRQRAVVSGQEDMIGSVAKVLAWQGSSGRVRVHGEIWQARGEEGLMPGQRVQIKAIRGLTLDVSRSERGEAS